MLFILACGDPGDNIVPLAITKQVQKTKGNQPCFKKQHTLPNYIAFLFVETDMSKFNFMIHLCQVSKGTGLSADHKILIACGAGQGTRIIQKKQRLCSDRCWVQLDNTVCAWSDVMRRLWASYSSNRVLEDSIRWAERNWKSTSHHNKPNLFWAPCSRSRLKQMYTRVAQTKCKINMHKSGSTNQACCCLKPKGDASSHVSLHKWIQSRVLLLPVVDAVAELVEVIVRVID